MRKHVFFMLLMALLVPWAARAQETVTIGTGTSTTSNGPFNSLWGYSFVEQVYTAAEINMAGTITKVRFQLAQSYTSVQTNNIELYMKNVSRSSFSSTSDYEQVSTSDIVYSGQWTIPANYTGWVEIELDTPFEYDGTSNLMVAMHEYTSGYSTRYFNYSTATGTLVSFHSDSANPDPYNLGSYTGNSYTGNNRPNIQLDIMAGDISCYPVKNLSIDEITDESMTLSWIDTNNTGATYTVYAITATDTTVLQSGISDTSYIVTDLSASTNYRFGVQTDCGAGDLSSMRYVEGRTACGAIPIDSMPYTYGFEDATGSGASNTFDPCYGRYTNYTTAYPYPSTTQKHSGTYGLYFYSTASYYSYTTMPLFEEDFSNLMLSFWAYRTSATYGHWAVGIMSDPSDITTFDTIAFGQVSANSTWELIEVPLNGYTGEGNYIAIMSPIGSAASYLYVDDINVGPIPACVRPLGITVTDITATTATININDPTENGSYMLWIGTDSVEVTGMTYELTDLQPASTYNVTVKSMCSDGTMTNAVYGTFATPCVAISEFPWMQDFDAITNINELNCWDRYTGLYNDTAAFSLASTTSGWLLHSAHGMEGSQHMKVNIYGTGCKYWLMTPTFEITSGIQLSFDYSLTTYNSDAPIDASVVDDRFIVFAITEDTTFVPLGKWGNDSTRDDYSYENVPNTPTSISFSLDQFDGQNVRFAFYGESTVSGDDNDFHIDNIYVGEASSCPKPTLVWTTNITSEGATISWSDPAGAGSYVVTYQAEGSTEEPESVTVSDTTVDLTELLPNTTYAVSVMADCGGEQSAPRSTTFRTACVPMTVLPWSEDFENAATGTSAQFPYCMYRLNNGTSTSYYPYVNSSTTYNHTPNGGKGLYWYNSTTTGYGDYQIVVLPAIDAETYPMNTVQVRFWAKSSSTTYHPVFQVGVMTDPTDASTFELVQTVDVGTNTTWTEFTVAMGTYTGEGQYVAIKAVRPASSWYAYVDDITLEPMPHCPAVIDLTATPTVTNAAIAWSYQAGYDAPGSYVVTYDSIGGTTPVAINATTNNIVLSGLEPNTTYKLYVKADCGNDGFGQMDSIEFATLDFGCEGLTEVDYSTSTSGVSGCIAYSSYGNTVYQAVWTAAELAAAGLTAGPISAIDLGFTSSTYAKEFTIYLGNTTTASISNATIEDPSTHTHVYGPASHPAGTEGWQHYEFDTVFNWDGTSNIIMTTFMNQPTGTTQTASTGLTGYYVSAANKARYRYRDSQQYTLSNLTEGNAGSTYSYRAAIHFYNGVCTGVATCANPAVVVSGATTSTVELTWAPGADETSWNVDYRLVGDTVWTNVANNISANSYTVTGLNDGMAYQFRVWFTCNGGSVYAGNVTASTLCGPKTLPYTENFDNLTTSTTAANPGVIPLCWDYVLTGTSTYQGDSYRPGVYYGANYAASGDYSLRLYGVGYFMLPEMSAPLDSLRITFSDTVTSASYGLIVGVMENGSFMPIDTVELTTGRNQVELMLNNYHGTSRTIALCNYYTSGTSTYYSYHYIDDLVVDYIPGCAHVSDIVVDSVANDCVTLSWTSNGQENQWIVTTDNGNPTIVTAPTITITGLTPSTPYTFEVRAFCGAGDTSEAVSVDVRTTQVPVTTFPYSTGFEAGEDQGWVLANGTNGWYIDTAAAQTGSYGLYISNNNGVANSYTISTVSKSWAYRTVQIAEAGDFAISFSWRANGEGNYDYLRAFLVPTSYVISADMLPGNSTPYNFRDVTPEGWIDMVEGKLNLQSEWQSATGVFPVQQAGLYNVVFLWCNDGSGGNQPPAAIDNVMMGTVSCAMPADLVVDSVTESTISVHWTPDGDATTWVVRVNNASPVTVNDTFYTFTGLSASTMYSLSVSSICGAGDTSFALTENCRTACGVITHADLPYEENFDSYATGTSGSFNPCWSRMNTYSTSYAYPYVSTTHHGATGNSLYFYSSSSQYNLAVMPQVDDVSDLMLSFYMYSTSTLSNVHFKVGVMTNPADTSTFVSMGDVILSATSTWEYMEVYFGTYTGTGNYIAFMAENNGASVYIDDVVLEVAPACQRPTGIEVSNITDNSAEITVVDPNSANNYRVYITNNGVTDSMNITSATAVFTGLTSATTYIVSVLTICDDGTLTRSISTNFTTALCSGAQVVATGNPDSTTSTSNAAPVNNYYHFTLSETIIDSVELGGPMEITSIAYYYNYTSPTTVKTDVTIWLQPTSKSEFTSTTDIVALDSTTAVMVYQGNLNCTQGWNYFGFVTPYSYDGNGNLLVIVDDNSDAYNGSAYVFKTMATTEYKTMSYYSDSYDADPLNPGSYSGNKYRYQWRPVMQLISCGEGCPAPIIGNVAVTSNDVTVNFTADGTVEAAIVEGATFTATTGTAVTGNTYTFTNLQPATEYTFGLRTLCEDGAASSWVTRTVTTDSAVCFVPTNVTVSATTFDGATITWTAGGEETAWEVRVYSTTFDQTYTANTNSLTVSGLNEGTFNVSVRAICSATNSSEWSEPIQFTTESCVAPTGVTVSGITANSATVSWPAVATSNGSYTMEYGFSGFSRGQGTTVEVTGTTYTITGLESEAEYDVYVASYCGENIVSPWSTVTSFTTIGGQETYTITVQSNNTAWGTVTGGGTYPAGTQVTLTATATSIGEFVEWQDGNTEAQRSIVVTGNATYTATFREKVGIDDVDGNAIALYPNPASTTVTIAGMELQSQIVIVDMNGREVYRATAADGSVKVDVSNLSKGAYFVRITGEKTNAIRKLVVK